MNTAAARKAAKLREEARAWQDRADAAETEAAERRAEDRARELFRRADEAEAGK